jgi:hypothetical protein
MTEPEKFLAKALTDLLIAIDLSDDDDIEPEVAMDLLEPVATLPQTASAETRQTLVELITRCAEEETDPDRRLTALDLPNAIGII